MTGSCHRGRRGGRSEIRIGLISPIVFTLLLIHLTDIRALANAQQPCDVRCSPDNNSESYIQYLSHHLSYHKRGVEEGDDSIRSPLRRREPVPGRWKCFVGCETATIIKQSDGEEDIIMPTI